MSWNRHSPHRWGICRRSFKRGEWREYPEKKKTVFYPYLLSFLSLRYSAIINREYHKTKRRIRQYPRAKTKQTQKTVKTNKTVLQHARQTQYIVIYKNNNKSLLNILYLFLRCVGLSNILDSELCRRKPTKRSHRKVVGTTIVDRKLLSEVLKRIEGVTGIEPVSYTHLIRANIICPLRYKAGKQPEKILL